MEPPLPSGGAAPAPERSISVIIAVHNGERFIGDALASVAAQTVPPTEVCVVDDGSDDGTGAVVGRFAGVRCLRREPNAGQAMALNWGVAATSGAYLAFLDADDLWVPEKLARQCQAFRADPTLELVYGMMRESVLGPVAGAAGRDGGVRPAQLPSAMMIKRASFEKVGGFDTRWTLGSVVDWHARACEAGLRQLVLPEILYERRIHGDNIGIKAARHRQDYVEVVKAALDRRRAAARKGGGGSDGGDGGPMSGG